MKEFIRKVLPFLLLVGILCVLFWQVLFQGYVFIDGDNFHLNIPLKYLLVDALHQRYFPFWNPYILGGIPYAADLNLGTFNLLNFLYFHFPIPQALSLQVILDLLLVGSFMYIFLRRKVDNTIALLGAIIFMLSGVVFTFTTNVSILNVIIYIPLLFHCIEKLFESKNIRYFIALIFIQVLQIISGHPQITYYTIIFMLLFIAFQTKFSLKKRTIICSAYLLSSLLISSFQLLPFFEYVLHSSRQTGIEYASSGSFGLSQFITIFFPTFFGTKLAGNWWGSQATLFGYIGVASLVFFSIGMFYKSFHNKRYYVFALLLSFFLSLGKWGGVFFLFYFFIPGFSSLRSIGDIFVLTVFFATIFVAYGLQHVISKRKTFYIFGKYLTYISLVIIIASLLLIYAAEKLTSWQQVFIYLQHWHFPFAQKILFYSSVKIQSMFDGIASNVLIFSIFIFATGFLLWRIVRYKRVAPILFVLLITLDLLFADRTYLQLAPLSFYHVQLVNLQKDLVSQEYRLYSQPVVTPQDRKFLSGPKYFYNESQLNLLHLTDDHVVSLKILDITGYTALVLKNYDEFLHSNSITGINTNQLTQEELNELSVKYVISNNNLLVNQSALPRARLLDMNNCKSVLLQGENSHVIIVHTTTQINDTLVLADTYYPGWKAVVNGKNVSIRQYKNIFMSVEIPKGSSTIVFFYDPLIWKIGTLLSIIGLLALFLLVKW